MITQPAFVDELTEDVCKILLASHHVGRLAFLGDDGFPVILPVNYVVDGADIVVRTNHGETYDNVPRHRVGFEVDAIDDATRTGWSLLVRGDARDVTESAGERYAMSIPEPFLAYAPGDRHAWIAIRVDQITGRQIVRPHSPSDVQTSSHHSA